LVCTVQPTLHIIPESTASTCLPPDIIAHPAAELPESLKALFRPITVVVPDRQLIMENMLMAEVGPISLSL
jgi:hypothetical protein